MLAFLLALPGPARANGPMVCETGEGNRNGGNYDLTNCGIPVGVSAYVELSAFPFPYGFSNGSMIYMALGEWGGQVCQVRVAPESAYSCAITVEDGVLDAYIVSGEPQNYRLVASPISSSDTAAPALIEPNYSVYTTTLPSGDVVTVERRTSYGELHIVTLLIFVTMLSVLSSIMMAVRFKG